MKNGNLLFQERSSGSKLSPASLRLRTRLNNRGQGLTEYATLLVLVSLAAVGITKMLGSSVVKAISRAQKRIDAKVIFKESGEMDRDDGAI